tara:strand:+ start:1239 stop:2024 length:786 start_codon:yes stop_codon:yes gene_type:complete
MSDNILNLKKEEKEDNNLVDNDNNKSLSKTNSLNLGDPFWSNNINVLFDKDNISAFFPTMDMTLIEKLNSLMRLSVYLSIILYLFTSNYLYLYIMILVGAVTYFIFTYQLENINLYLNSISDSDYNLVQKNIIENTKETFDNQRNPTVSNPFMNINLITEDPAQKEPPPSWNNEEIKEKIENKFNYNLYRDVGDLYGKNNSQRQFYTTPSTTIPNNQTAFAKWCYNTGPTCKEKSLYCAPEMDASPYIDQTDPYKLVPKKY